jgi:hypothetical protein
MLWSGCFGFEGLVHTTVARRNARCPEAMRRIYLIDIAFIFGLTDDRGGSKSSDIARSELCLSQRSSFTPGRINDRIDVNDWYFGLPDGKGFTPFDFQSEV